jgi:hypothetical protein
MVLDYVVHEIAIASLEEWRRRLGVNRRGSSELANVYLETMEAELVRHLGAPPGSIAVPRFRPPMIVWEFQPGLAWAVYTIQRSGSRIARLLGKTAARVVLLAIAGHRPHRVELELLAKALKTWDRRHSAR